jgi:formylglycine-generating enzyme required for sulfatase activity
MKLVSIPAGTFTMGSPKNEEGRNPDEEQHEVEISAFYMGAYEVTQQ